jgi:hypothetical protein
MAALRKTLFPIMIALALGGCAGQQKELLEKDYLHLSNNELLSYYDNLSAEIDRCQNERNRAAVGVGSGYGHGGVGVSLGLSHGFSTCNPDKLILRRNEVMAEMKRRGYKP